MNNKVEKKKKKNSEMGEKKSELFTIRVNCIFVTVIFLAAKLEIISI